MQRLSLPNHVIPTLLLADGIVCILFAVLAHAMGIDPNPDWGRSRALIFLLGVLVMGASFFLYVKRPALARNEILKTVFLLGHIWAVILLIYTWFITFGTFTEWRASTHYYSLQADAFAKGQLHVDIEPGATLLGLDDPYDPDANRDIDDEIWDMSLYKGKLYLYWGPVPALILLPAQLIFHKTLQDIYLVYFFFSGLLVVNSLLILKLWHRLFADIPSRYVVAAIFVIGLILPVLWSLNIPDVYEAALGAGQFFLIGGIYFAVLAFDDTVRNRYLFLAGFFWAGAVGSRAMNVLPLLLIMPLMMFWVYRVSSSPLNWKKIAGHLFALGLPLALGAVLIGWYNWARFDSPFEFGFRYQITIHNLIKDSTLVFQPDYFLPNLYAYVFQPFEFISKFPFIRPVTIMQTLERLSIEPPKLFFSGRLTGFLVYAPFLVLAFLSLRHAVRSARGNSDLSYQFPVFLLAIGFAVNFISLLFFFFGQLRYTVDVISQITLLAILGYWELIRLRINSESNRWKVLAFVANLLITVTIVFSMLLAFTSETGRIEKYNPELIHQLNVFFGG